MTIQQAGPGLTRRERQRISTLEEIITVSRELLRDPGELSLRAVAGRMGMTAPALYRYLGSYQELVYLVADRVDREVAGGLSDARDRYPADDPAARIVAAATVFRNWALGAKAEFGLLFTNPITSRSLEERDEISGTEIGNVFCDLIVDVYDAYQFAIPTVAELDPDVVRALREPFSPAIPCQFPEEMLGLGWVVLRAWAALYGTVTLEVYSHLDPYIIRSGAMFRAMLAEQAPHLGLAGQLDRLVGVMNKESVTA